MRLILLVHRYLAVVIGILMALWCLSGFVMMYQGYPYLTEEERLAGLEPLDLEGCCNLGGVEMPGDAEVSGFEIEMLLGHPVLRLADVFGPFGPAGFGASGALNLRTGAPVGMLSADEAAEVAREYGLRHGLGDAPRALGPVEIDQWIVEEAPRNQPAYRFAFDDPAGTEIYVSGRSGKVFKDTDRRERILAWLGAIPHWLYPLELRKNGPLWTSIVVWTSGLGTFLALTGLAVGIWRFRFRGEGGRRSPFRGWWYWHHIAGLVFGVLTLTWVFSGLMTMDPWGFLYRGGSRYEAELRGATTWGEVKRFLAAPPVLGARHDVVQLKAAPFDGRLYVLARKPEGGAERLDAAGLPAEALTRLDVVNALGHLDAPIADLALLERGDHYYYRDRGPDAFPVYRAVLDDPERTRLYINPATAAVVGVDAPARASRWIIGGLHDIDFAVIRARPLWDVAVLLLLAGVTTVTVTGTWLAFKRVRLDARRLGRHLAIGRRGTST